MEDNTISQQVIRRVLTMVDEEFAAISVGELARLFETDRYKLSRQFKTQTGMTLEEFLYKEKMTRAALLLLAYKNITVKKVAEKIGFCSPDYFIRKFRQFFGVVPGKYSEFKAKRSGIRDRRNGDNDRRQRVVKTSIPGTGDRRTGPKNRRKRNSYHNDQINPHSLPERGLEVMESKKGNPCEKCYFRLFALNFDDLK
ncbi:MAG: AraC family transcriptional regulator [Candidatus Aminicenantes bacterium]|jgi:AraC-like DNA-binding protein